MLVYLAHPIDQTDGTHNGVGNVIDLLDSTGISYYRPGAAFTVHLRASRDNTSDLEIVDRINTFSLRAADALVAWLPPGVATLGVPAEIESALHQDKPVLILTSGNLSQRSVQLINWSIRGATVVNFDHKQSLRWQAAPDALRLLLEGKPSAEWGFLDAPAANRQGDPVQLLPQVEPSLRYTLADGAKPLTRGHSDDAGLDLAILNDERLEPGEYRMLPTGIKAAVPHGYWGMITGRSSTWAKYRCDVRMAVIDAGYRGELMVGIENRTTMAVHFKSGTRLAQYVILPAFLGHAVETASLPGHARGENGYGSTGE